MRRERSIGLLVAGLTAIGLASCGPKRIVELKRPGDALVALLPDSDTGRTGRAHVTNSLGSADLTRARAAALAATDRPPTSLGTLSEAEVTRIFGKALAGLPPAPQTFTLFFRFDSDELTDDSRSRLADVVTAAERHGVPEVAVIGHTDTMGESARNYHLGLKRATTVRDLLVSAGLEPSSIEVESHGEADLLVHTLNDVAEPRNRRVEVTVK